ncbi:MAG: glycosyltransferase family 2 protein [Oscillospiraceae bacterium]|nr:glycosyltransferase family 2 protein [Oscillospiraceae bacterium]
MPKISVIVPVYKVEPYLHRCVDSVLNQTFTDFELILVDDGSPDNCGAICDEYAEKDPRVRVIHKENGGVSSARNAGLDAARGEFVAFLDGDDSWDDMFLSVMITAAEQGQRDLVSCTCRSIVNNENAGGQIVKPAVHILPGYEARMQYLHGILLQCKEGWEVWTRLFRTNIIRQNQIRFCTTCENFAEDLEFVAQYVLHASSIQALDTCMYNYNVRSGSMMRNSREIIRLDAMNEISYSLGRYYNKKTLGRNWDKYLAITHFMVMYCQYAKVLQLEKLPQMGELLNGIKNQQWFKNNTAKIFSAFNLLTSYIGKDDALRVMMFSAYCLHKNWWIYRITRGFYNRVFGYR